MKKKNLAFTLAEVLITLSIIGVVAALTIPALLNYVHNQENVSAFKKEYGALFQATNLIISEQGTPDKWEMVDGNNDDTNRIMGYYAKYLKSIKSCKAEDDSCKYQGTLLNLYGTVSSYYRDQGNSMGYNTFQLMLADGAYISFDEFSNRSDVINYWRIDPGYDGSAYGIFVIDVNGFKKPNQLGRDVFAAVLTNKGLAPAGMSNDSALCKVFDDGKSGADCATKVLRESAENY